MEISNLFVSAMLFYSFSFFVLFAQTIEPPRSEQKHPPTAPSHRDFIKVSSDTLFACIDIFNYFTNRKFESFFNDMKKLGKHESSTTSTVYVIVWVQTHSL